VSAVQKIARVMPIPPGLPLYRGLGGNVSMPPKFYKTDENQCRGFAEWGFMSTTSDRQVGADHASFLPRFRCSSPPAHTNAALKWGIVRTVAARMCGRCY
jgi:hypothetical protein